MKTGTIHILDEAGSTKGIYIILFLLFACLAIYWLGLIGLIFSFVLPFLFVFIYKLFKEPKSGIWFSLVLSFLISGITRYINLPWGLGVDIILFISWIALLFKRNIDWSGLKNDIFLVAAIWFIYICLEFFNTYGNGAVAWFYAMRGIGFYQLLTFGLVFLLVKEIRDVERFIWLLIFFSVLGSLWGFKQQFGILDYAENHWLFAENHQDEHLLHGVLRVFSFYSDAGQFGANQAMMFLFSGILFIGPHSKGKKILFLLAFVMCFLGFAISGTRGALAVPAFGGLAYLLINKNFKVLLGGLAGFALVFYILKYTFLFQGVEQVRRMRSALDAQNPSLLVRLENQKTFANYLADKPFGGGVGTAGYWGFRFNPNSLLAKTATDSWYVKIWAETGLVGIVLHIGFLFYIMGMAYVAVTNLQNPRLRSYAHAIYASIAGVLASSYGNQVFGQMPTGMIMNIAIPLLFIIHKIDRKTQS